MKGDTYSERELIDMIGGDGNHRETAIRILMQEELRTRRLSGSLAKLGASPIECEELVNDAFVALIMSVKKGSFKPGSSIWGYLYGAAKNMLWKLRRGKKPEVAMQGYVSMTGAVEESIEDHIIRGERKEWLLGVFNQLTEKCRHILHLAFFEEADNQEIADTLEYKSKSVVSVKKSECLKALAKLLKNARSF
jgi:RNA polymerase sigma factor (sigma-70 family)